MIQPAASFQPSLSGAHQARKVEGGATGAAAVGRGTVFHDGSSQKDSAFMAKMTAEECLSDG